MAVVGLSAPVTADVAADGRLLRADDAILRLHERAGGIAGGAFAVPGLAEVARATFRIKMRLAGAVRVSNEEDNLELWVESRLEGDVARLIITSWRALNWPEAQGDLKRRDERNAPHDSADLVFDRNLRLVSLGMTAPVDMKIGMTADQLFDTTRGSGDVLLRFMEKHEVARVDEVYLTGHTERYSVLADTIVNSENVFAGYSCELRAAINDSKAGAADHQASVSMPIFGQQLAPVLRQPLGRIIANAETIGSKLQGPIRESYASYAKDIANAARHLVALVDDLGDLEAIERPGFSTAEDAIELGDIARRVAGLLALKAADHRINIIIPPDDLKVAATAEFRRVLQILINLVTNALRYSPDGTKVIIGIAQSGKMALLTVSDEGSGIAPEDSEKIFEKFERLGRSGDGGSGLGLYISRRLAHAMGGDLAVRNRKEGGAEFTLSLPSG